MVPQFNYPPTQKNPDSRAYVNSTGINSQDGGPNFWWKVVGEQGIGSWAGTGLPYAHSDPINGQAEERFSCARKSSHHTPSHKANADKLFS